MEAPKREGYPGPEGPALMTPATRGGRWKALGLQLLLFAVIWANIEMYCHRQLRVEGLETDQATGVLDPNTGNWLLNVHKGYNNEDGLHNPSVPPPTDPKEIRVFCLGGSTTMGWGVQREEGYVRQLERILRAKAPPGVTITTINGGVAGFGSYQCMKLLARLGPRYRPQIVTAMCGFNERNSFLYQPSSESYQDGWSSASLAGSFRHVFYRSPTYRYLWRKLHYEDIPAAREAPVCDISLANLGYMSQYLASKDVRFLLMTETQTPSLDETPDPRRVCGADRILMRDKFRDLAERRGFPFVDIDDLLLYRSGKPEKEILLDQTHMTVEANRMCAQILAERLWALRWIPCVTNPQSTGAPAGAVVPPPAAGAPVSGPR